MTLRTLIGQLPRKCQFQPIPTQARSLYLLHSGRDRGAVICLRRCCEMITFTTSILALHQAPLADTFQTFLFDHPTIPKSANVEILFLFLSTSASCGNQSTVGQFRYPICCPLAMVSAVALKSQLRRKRRRVTFGLLKVFTIKANPTH